MPEWFLGDLIERGQVTQTPTGCWEWNGARQNQGYGTLTMNGKHTLAHRASYAIVHGVPENSVDVVRHRCDNKPCINPMHLEGGTLADNMRDYLTRGRRAERHAEPHNRKMTDEIVANMRRRVRAGEKVVALAAEHDVSLSAAYQAVRGRTWQFLDEPPVRASELRVHNLTSRITAERAEEIRRRRAAGESVRELAFAYDLGLGTVYDIVRGRSWNPPKPEPFHPKAPL